MKICIIGAGIAGIISAINCIKHNFDIVIIEKQSDYGGCWLNYATNETTLQTDANAYFYFYYKLCKKNNIKNINYDKVNRENILYLCKDLAKQYNLDKYIKFNTEVLNLKETEKNIYTVLTNNETYIFNAVMVCSGYLCKPKHCTIENYTKEIQYSYNLDPIKLINKDVLIIGWGSYAIQSLITANKYHAKKITLMGRNAKWVVDKKYLLLLLIIYNNL